MKKLYCSIILVFGIFIFSCDPREGETVESAYFIPPLDVYKYKFSRNGSSSVDILEKDLVETPMDYIYSSYLKQARISGEDEWNIVMDNYKNDLGGGVILENQIASSSYFNSKKEQIKQDVLNMIETSAKIAGYYGNPTRSTSAFPGQSGYIGENVSDPNLAFVDEKGIVVAEVFYKMLLGAVHLDKILYKHLDDSVIGDSGLREKHENLELLPGKNYTELEHNWDLAYGYYTRWKPFAQPQGIEALKDSDTKIIRAFVLGRHEMGRYQYQEVEKHIQTIREELSKVVAIRTMSQLVGLNTLANLNEEPTYSFPYLSEAYGLIYTLQFTRKPDGTPYFSYDEVKEIQSELVKGAGLWETKRLLSDVEVEGSLRNIARKIGEPYGVSLESIKR